MGILKGDLSNDLILQGKVVYSVRHLSVVILTEIYYKVVLQGVLSLQQSPSAAERHSNPVSTDRQTIWLPSLWEAGLLGPIP